MNDEALKGIIMILSLAGYFFNSANPVLEVIKIEDMINVLELKLYYLKSQKIPI